jgi:hypothetical protein
MCTGVDAAAGSQQFSVTDESGSGAGWHITVAGTTFTNRTYTLPDSGTFVLTGSVSSVNATTRPATWSPWAIALMVIGGLSIGPDSSTTVPGT